MPPCLQFDTPFQCYDTMFLTLQYLHHLVSEVSPRIDIWLRPIQAEPSATWWDNPIAQLSLSPQKRETWDEHVNHFGSDGILFSFSFLFRPLLLQAVTYKLVPMDGKVLTLSTPPQNCSLVESNTYSPLGLQDRSRL